MERRWELLLFVLITFVIPLLVVLIDVFFLTDILLIVFAIIWMGFCLVILTPSIRGD